MRGLAWGAWDPVTGVPRIDCTDTVTHAYYTRKFKTLQLRRQALAGLVEVKVWLAGHKDKVTGKEIVSPVNRFYGSSMFAPKGPGLSVPGYLPVQEPDAMCTDQSGASRVAGIWIFNAYLC